MHPWFDAWIGEKSAARSREAAKECSPRRKPWVASGERT
jgi:hypothetical protein